jgi:hypothetical protein
VLLSAKFPALANRSWKFAASATARYAFLPGATPVAYCEYHCIVYRRPVFMAHDSTFHSSHRTNSAKVALTPAMPKM